MIGVLSTNNFDDSFQGKIPITLISFYYDTVNRITLIEAERFEQITIRNRFEIFQFCQIRYENL